MLRVETKARARALQVLYAWDVQGRPSIEPVVAGASRLCRRPGAWSGQAEALATGVARDLVSIDRQIAEAADRWRLERIGAVERNILRIGLLELREGNVPPRVAIDEAVRLARWFAGWKAPAFVNGLLDALARQMGRL